MSLILQRETTEYIYTGVSGDVPSSGGEIALLGAGQRPSEPDWNTAVIVDEVHQLWADAQRSQVPGDYYVAILVGSFGGNLVDPGVGDYAIWVRLTDQVERPVRISPVSLEIV
jgi:hypothetical protein